MYRQELHGKFLYLSLSFAMNPKTALKCKLLIRKTTTTTTTNVVSVEKVRRNITKEMKSEKIIIVSKRQIL